MSNPDYYNDARIEMRLLQRAERNDPFDYGWFDARIDKDAADIIHGLREGKDYCLGRIARLEQERDEALAEANRQRQRAEEAEAEEVFLQTRVSALEAKVSFLHDRAAYLRRVLA